LPKIGAPKEIFGSNPTAEQAALKNYLETLGAQIRQNETAYIIYPLEYDDKGHKLFDVELLTSGGERQFDTSAVIDRYDNRMLMSVLADFLLLGSKETGSYALGETKLETFLKAIKTWLDTICDQVNRYAIPRLLELNGMSSERAPYLEAGTLETVSLEALGRFVDILVKAGVQFTPEEQMYLKSRANIPVDAKSQPSLKKTEDNTGKPDETNNNEAEPKKPSEDTDDE
ncbi:MAG: hypothetical protein AB7J13_12045, partial [Pyrinomonadaceae bacterium]